MTAAQQPALPDRLFELLASEGFRPKKDKDGDFEFKHQGLPTWLEMDPDDPTYLRLLVPNCWSLDSEDELKRAYRAASEVGLHCKGVKVSIYKEKDVWITVEFLISVTDPLDPQLMLRRLVWLETGFREFKFRMTAREPNEIPAPKSAAVH